MKKLMLFMLLFVAGLSVLRWIEDPVPVEAEESGIDESESQRAEPITVTRSESRTEDEAIADSPSAESESDIKMLVKGPLSFTKNVEEGPNRLNKLFHVESEDSRTIDGGYVELEGVTAIAFDEESQEEILRIKAGKGRAAINDLFGEDILLYDVELTLLRNAPVVPLTLRTDELICSLQGEGRFRSDLRVTIEGQGLTAAGVGFDFESVTGLLRFERDGFADVELKPGHRSKLTCDGSFEIGRSQNGLGPILLNARDNAVLSRSGTSPVNLGANRLRITGRPNTDQHETLAFQRIEADGEVVLSMTGNQFRSDRAEIELVDNESHFRAAMSGDPNGTFRLTGEDLVKTGATLLATNEVDPDSKPLAIEFSGEGPLIVNRRTETTFRLVGPAKLSWSDAKLDAVDSISGIFGPGKDDAVFVASGEVRVQRDIGSLSTPEFRLEHKRSPAGASLLTAVAGGPSNMAGVVDEEHNFLLTSKNEIEFALDGALWQVPRANGINLTVDGPRGFVAHADQVTEFSPDPLQLVATGDIALTGSRGDITGERLSLRGLDDLTVEGVPGELAHFKSESGEWYALHVERKNKTITAKTVEQAIFSNGADEFRFDCERMIVEDIGNAAPNEAGMSSKGFRFLGSGKVRGTATFPDELFEMDCNEFRGEWIENLRGEEFLFSESSFDASDSVHSRFMRNQYQYDLRSDSVTYKRTNRGSETLTSDKLTAVGNIEVQMVSDARMSGKGDRFEIDKFGRGELIADEGKRISAEGVMAEGKLPFSMTASRLLISDTYLDASFPEFEFLTTAPSIIQSGEDRVRASAERMEYEAIEDKMTLTKDVRMEGVLQGKNSWVLLSDIAQIDIRRTSGSGILAALSASGQVEFDFQGVMHAEGESFQFKTARQRIRIAGAPAKIFYREINIETPWIEYDLLIHTINTHGDAVFTPL